MPSRSFDVLVLGAGAAGLMGAIEAGRRGRRVGLIDHGERAGRKILISGGGRCNFTNLQTEPRNFLSENPHFARSALTRYAPADFIAMVEQHRIPYHEKTLGQLFCDRSAKDILTMLERECGTAGVELLLGTQLLSLRREDDFIVETSRGRVSARTVVVATGGLSIPKIGATGIGYELARQFGIGIVEPRPALVPLVFTPADGERWCDLTGLSVPVEVSAGAGARRAQFHEKLLLTHRGLSGPAVLQISSYWRPGAPVMIDLAPGRSVTAPLRAGKAGRTHSAALASLRTALPARLAERWMTVHPPEGWTNAALDRWEHGLHTWTLCPAGTEGYAKAEVTAGGVDTAELDPRTLESRRVPGLYFIGEVVDVTGWLGGYNFQWAWASGACAGRAC